MSLYLYAKLNDSLSKLAVTCNLLLLAKGRGVSWTLSMGDLRWLAWRVPPLVFGCFCLESYGEFAEARKYTTGYIYDTPVGIMLVMVDILLFFIFIGLFEQTHRLELDALKKMFYKVFGVLATAWFLSMPFLAVVGLYLGATVRHQVLWAAQRSVHFLAVLSLVMLFDEPKTSYVNLQGQEGLKPHMLGSGVLKLNTGPLPEQTEELNGSEMELFGEAQKAPPALLL